MQNLNKQRTRRDFIGLALMAVPVVALTSFSPLSAFAVTSAEKQAEADEITVQIEALRTQIDDANAEYVRALGEYDAASAAAEEAAARVAAANERIAELQKTLSGRATSMYKTGGSVSMLDVLLESSSFEEFLTTWDAFDKITEQDAAMIQETKDTRTEAEEAQAEYEKQMAIAEEELANIEAAKAEIEAALADMEVMLAEVNVEIENLLAREEEERLAAEEAQRRAEEAAAIGASYSGGGSTGSEYGSGEVSSGWAHPLPSGYMSNPFGWAGAWDGCYHNGVDYAAGTGTPIYAACSGTVKFVGWYGSGGNAVMINHGNGVLTTYMHMSGFGTSVGASVSAGDVVGYVGTTGYSTGPHLHFQVDINGVPVDGRQFVGW